MSSELHQKTTEKLGPILDPVGETSATADDITERLDDLEGKTIGLLDNCKTNADIFLDEIGKILKDKYGVTELVVKRKSKASTPAGEIVTHLAENCDAVVNAYGDCGSCTSWTVYDSVELEKNHAIPTATIESTEFLKLGQSESRSLGLPGLPLIEVPHPMGDVSEEVVRERAHVAIEEIVKSLTAPAEDLEAEYTEKYLGAGEELGDEDLHCPL